MFSGNDDQGLDDTRTDSETKRESENTEDKSESKSGANRSFPLARRRHLELK